MRLVFKLREEDKHYFRRPIGIPIYKESNKAMSIVKELIKDFKPPIVATVGDFVSHNALLSGLQPTLVVFDMKVERKYTEFSVQEELVNSDYEIVEVQNPPSTITYSSYRAIEYAIDRSLRGFKIGIHVIGEDDLLTIPVVLLSPIYSMVLYGQPGYCQPGEALVIVIVTKYLKTSLRSVMEKLGADIGSLSPKDLSKA